MKTNNLIYKTSKIVGGENISVNISLNDECKNGHQDFSITGDIYEAGKPKIDRYFLTGGCIHDDILKHFPKFKIFIDLHLCDWNGIPMHAVSNGFYFLRQGFNNTKPNDPNFKSEFCNYYRLTPEQFEVIKTSETKDIFAYHLGNLGIFEQWKKEANEAIKLLEELTGNEFLVDSIRTHLDVNLSDEQKKDIEENRKSGYFAPEKIAQRQKEEAEHIKARRIESLKEDAKSKIKEIGIDLDIDIALINEGFSNHCAIYYKHTKTIKFNWGSDKLTDQEIERAKIALKDIAKKHDLKFEQ